MVAADGAEFVLRKQGLGVIHGGENSLRFTPHFGIRSEEVDLIIEDQVERGLAWPEPSPGETATFRVPENVWPALTSCGCAPRRLLL